MSTTLSYLGVTLDLHDDLLWPDEYEWQAVEQDTSHSVTGALIVQPALKQAGQPVTLIGSSDSAWMPRATLDTLRAWANVPGRVMTLHLRGADRSVIWDHKAGPIKTIERVEPYSDPLPIDRQVVSLHFLTVTTPTP